jgi:hypothetical protein
MEQYRVPKRQIEAEVVLPGQAPARLHLFLNERAQAHAGRERPSDILNGTVDFLPAFDARGHVVFINREALSVVSVAAEHELDADAPRVEDLASDQTTRARIEVVLQDGSTLLGVLSYLMPEAQRRMQDFLNMSDRFLILREEGVVHLVNKRSIVRVVPL